MNKIKVGLVDDHVSFTDSLKIALSLSDQIEISYEVNKGEDCLTSQKVNPADVILLDYSMPELNGREVAERLLSEKPDTRIIALTMHDEQQIILEMLRLGVQGYLLKTSRISEITEAVENVFGGATYYCKDAIDIMMKNTRKPIKIIDNEPPKLSRREKEVLKLILEECTTAEIGDKLGISPHTVESHRKSLLTKTGSRNVAGLVKFAITNAHLIES